MSVRGAFVTLFNVMLCKPRVRTLALAGLAVWACALPENAPPPDGGTAEGGTGNTGEGGSGNTAAGVTGGTSGTSTGGTGAGGSTSGGSTSGGSTTGGSTTGGSGGAGASTGGASGAGTGGAMSGAGGKGGTGGTVAGAGMGGTTAGAGMGGKGGTMAGAGMGGTVAGAGMGGAGAGGTPGILAHRYSFTGTGTTATDSVGTAHGTITGGSQANGVVTLMGGTSDQYVTLPANVLTGLTNATFEVWASWTGGTSNWQRIFDFGTSDGGAGMQGTTNTGSPYFFLTPRAQATTSSPNCTNNTASMPRVAITAGGPTTEDCAFGTAAFPMSALTHVAVVINLNSTSMTLYIDGSAVGGPVTLNTPLSSIAGLENNWLGRSQFSSDTEYAGTISEFRIYNVARSGAQITASAAAGPDSAPTQ